MKEIRLCKTASDVAGEPFVPGPWSPETPALRDALELLARAGNEHYGKGTHWVEERHTASGKPFDAASGQ